MKIIVQLTLLIIILHKTIAAFTNDINFNASIKTAQILIKKGQTEEALSIYLDLNEKFDLVFIDTLHVYGQLKRELEKFSKIAETYIILHDTTVDAEYGEIIRQNLDFEKIKELTNFSDEELTKGLWPAVEEFIAKNNDWEIQKKFENNNGLTILKKTKS